MTFGPAGTPTVAVVGAGFGGIATGVKLLRARHPHVHRLRGVVRHRRHVVGQHVPRCRGRRRLAPLLLLVQAARLDSHPRAPARAAAVPRGDGRRVRAAAAPAARCGRRVGDVGRRPPRLGAAARRRDGARVQRARERGRVPQRAPLPRVAGARRVRRPRVPHGAVGARARPRREGRGGGGRGLVVDAGRTRDPAARRAPLRVPAGAGLGHAQGGARPHAGAAVGARPAVAAPPGALAPEVPAGEEPVGRAPLPAGQPDEHRAGGVLPLLHRPAVRRAPRPARGRDADVPVPGQAPGVRQHLLPRARRSPTSSSCRARSSR